jgi:hypothetical protein
MAFYSCPFYIYKSYHILYIDDKKIVVFVLLVVVAGYYY